MSAPQPPDPASLPGSRDFAWRDGERIVVFRAGALADSLHVLESNGWRRFELLTTQRALAGAPIDLPAAAARVHEVPPGKVPQVAAALFESVTTPTLAALGGGRVIDTAKAIAAARGGRVAAIPTTLSGAEMTRIHRLPEGRPAPHLVRPGLVVADPEVMSGLAERELRASAMNALAHGAEALYTPLANPVGSLAALRGAALLSQALDQPESERDPATLALGSLLGAYAMDGAGYALHHVVCQTLVAVMDLPHAETNATMLPHTMAAMRTRAPEAIGALAAALGTDADRLPDRLVRIGGGPRWLSDLGADPELVGAAVEAISARAQLEDTPDPPAAEEIRDLIERAW